MENVLENVFNSHRQDEMASGDKIQTITVVKLKGPAFYYKVLVDIKFAKSFRDKIDLINIKYLIFKITPVSGFFCNIKYD
jgi:hypothetical protein